MPIMEPNNQNNSSIISYQEVEKIAEKVTEKRLKAMFGEYQSYQEVEKIAEETTTKKLTEMFGKYHLKDWLAGNSASLLGRTIFELELVAERMFKSEYLVSGFRAKENWLKEEVVRVQQDIGKYKAGLKLSEGGDFNFISIVEWIFKSGLAFVPIISLMKIIYPQALKTLEAGKGIDFSQAGQSWQVWLAVFAGIALVQLTSEAIYNWYISPSKAQEKKGYQNHFGILRLAVTNRFYQQPNEPKNLAINSSGKITSPDSEAQEKSTNNIGKQNKSPLSSPPTSEKLEQLDNLKDAKKRSQTRTSHFLGIDQFSILLIFICLIEALIGVAVIFPILQSQINSKLSITQRTVESIPTVNWWEIFLGVSIFALINLVFSVSKAKRHKHILRQQQLLKAAKQYVKHVKTDLKHCSIRIKQAQEDFKLYRKEYNDLWEKEGGILNRLSVLSNMAYTEMPQPIQKWTPMKEVSKSETQSEVPNSTNNNHKESQSSSTTV